LALLKRLNIKSDFVRHVVTLMTGTTVAQAIPIAMSPILTRIYTPEDFGLFALYMSTSALLAEVATGRYELAIMLPKKEDDARDIFILSVVIATLLSFLTLIVVFFFNAQITSLLGNKDISGWLYFIPFTIFLTGVYQSFNYWHNRHNEYKEIGTCRVSNAASNAVVNIISASVKSGPFGLIIGTIVGRFLGILYLIKSKSSTKVKFEFNKLKIIALAKKYKKFPLINSFHAFVDILKDNLANIYVSIKYSSAVLGFYYFVLRIMQLPSIMIGLAVSQVFYKKASNIYAETKDIQEEVIKLIKTLAAIAIIPSIIIFFYSQEIFSFVFGKEWLEAGRYAKALVPYIFFHFIASPIAMIPLITNRQGTAFYWGLLESSIYVLVFIVGYYLFGNLYDTLMLLSVTYVIYFPIYFRWIYKISKQ
jgi:O-antigen/teichoic acid export membrane protein